MEPVRTKLDFTRRYKDNEFGNHSPTFDTLKEYLNADCRHGLVHIRNRVAGAPTFYDVPSDQVKRLATEIIEQGIEKEYNLYFSLMCPTHLTLFQGEVQQSYRHLDLFYSTVPKPMRDSLKEGGKQVYGVEARFLLKHYMNAKSYDWLQHLFESYEDHVIEFTVLDCCWGTVSGYNTLFWEVRQY